MATTAPATAAPVAAPAAVVVPTPPPLVWTACEAANLQAAGAQCAMVTVPTDYEDVSAGTIQIAVSRVRHTSTTYQGAVLGNPGGSGLRMALLGARVPAALAAQYDWIGCDPRGVGSSVPSLHCDSTITAYDRPDYVATTPALRQVWLDRAASYSQACAAHNDLRLLNHMTTLDNVRDMESIRLALGRSQITIYGFSYGTYLAQVYATTFPGRLRRAVLDSNVDPGRVFYAANLDQDAAFEVTFRAFATWLANNNATYGLGATPAAVQQRYYQVLDQLRTAPQDGGRIGPDEWNDLFVQDGYVQSWWLYVAAVFNNAVFGGDYSGVTNFVPGPTDDDNGHAVYLATRCTDTTTWPRSYSGRREPDALRVAQQAPFITWNNTWFNAPCLTWPAAPHAAVAVGSSAAPPILLVGEELDAATPISGSFTVRSRFPQARLVEVLGGTSHAVSLRGNSCTDAVVVAYLTDGTLPARKASATNPDKTCKALPTPTPPAPGGGRTPLVAVPRVPPAR